MSKCRSSHPEVFFIKKETLAQVFSCEFCEIFEEHLQTTASIVVVVSHLVYHDSLLQNATAILLQNVAVFLQNATFITKRVGTL